MGEVVEVSEGVHCTIGMAQSRNAADFLVSRLFSDAVFSQDIRSIQLIINRIDGGLPKDTDVDRYQTEFGDCLNQILAMEKNEQLMVRPEDTVMMALCKSLYSIAVEDIYWDPKLKRKRNPRDSAKKDRDAAIKMVLDRAGGRKTLSSVPTSVEDVEIAGWIEELSKCTS